MSKRIHKNNTSQNKKAQNLKTFKCKIENEKNLDIAPLFVSMIGILYGDNEKKYDNELYNVVSMQRDLAYETIGKYFLGFIEKDSRKFNYQSDPEVLFFSDGKLLNLYKNICKTFFNTINILDELVFLNLNYDFSDKVFDFLQLSILFELYKLYLADREKEYDKGLMNRINWFIVKNSIMAYTKDIQERIFVKDGAIFFDYVSQTIKFLVNPESSGLNLEEQSFFKSFLTEFPTMVSFLPAEYDDDKQAEHFDTIYNGKNFSDYYEEKAKPYYKEVQYIPLIAMSGLNRKLVLHEVENLYKNTWCHSHIKHHMEASGEKICELNKTIDKIQRENKNLNRNYYKKEEENEALIKQVANNEKAKLEAVQKIKNELCTAQEELKTLKTENFCIKDKLAKQSNRIESLSEKINIQNRIINRVPNIHDFIDSENELDAVTESPLTQQQESKKPTLKEMKAAIRDKRLFFIHGIQGYEKNLEEVFNRYDHVCVNDKVANFTMPNEIDGVVALVKTTPHAHIDRATRMKKESVPFIPSTNKNIDLVIEDIYNFYYKDK